MLLSKIARYGRVAKMIGLRDRNVPGYPSVRLNTGSLIDCEHQQRWLRRAGAAIRGINLTDAAIGLGVSGWFRRAALLEKKTLSGEEITNLIEATMSGKCAQLLALPADGTSPFALSLSA